MQAVAGEEVVMLETVTRIFADRRAAGRELAVRLRGLAEQDPVVLGLARGGVPVAYEVAQALGAPLDVLVVRKIGAPGNRSTASVRLRRAAYGCSTARLCVT